MAVAMRVHSIPRTDSQLAIRSLNMNNEGFINEFMCMFYPLDDPWPWLMLMVGSSVLIWLAVCV